MDAKNISPNINSSQKLWRYMSLDKLINLLDSETLFFTPVNSYAKTDPFEGLIPRVGLDALGKIFKESQDMIMRDLRAMKESALKNSPMKNTLPQVVIEKLEELEEDISNHPKRMDAVFFNIMRNVVVNCWHQNDYESEAMWKLYSDLSKGIAIETTAGSLIDSVVDEKSHRIFFSEVQYIDFDSPQIRPQDCVVNGTLGILLKRIAFKHENEARLYFSPEKDYADAEKSKPAAEYVKVDVKKLIHKVYISPYATEPFPSSVKCIMKKFGFPEDKVIVSKLLSPEDNLLRIF